MKTIDERLRWRIMIGLGTDADGDPISKSWARRTAIDVADAGLDAYSITDGIGAWKGKQEPSLVIEYIGKDNERERTKLHVVAEVIAKYLNQEEVWVSEEPIVLTRIVNEMAHASIAAKVRAAKEKWPLRYCPDTRCLWNLSHGPCPKHLPEVKHET